MTRKPIGQRYECPDCEKQFFYQPESAADDGPSFCPKCGSDLSDGEAKVIQITRVNIGTHKGKSPDILYRQMESASEARAEEAADMLGVDKSEMSGLKITDMNDRLKPGDVAAKLPPNPVAETMKNTTALTGFQPSVVNFASSGDKSGVGAMINLNRRFAADKVQMTNAGRINK